jgi:proteasome lid subunit RPN8/RPN11
VIVLSALQLKQVTESAEAAYPEECCGLLVGRGAGDVEVTQVVPTPNIALNDSGAPRRRDRFEVDPETRFKVMRDTEGTGLRIVGHYHSHPDHPPVPSAHDLESALEPELVWVIVGVEKGRAGPVTAHLLDPLAHRFREIRLRIEG